VKIDQESSPVKDETNKVTKDQREPEDLHISELRYRRLFESARDGILMLDAATRKITDVNPFMVELLGYSRDEFLGKQLWEIGLFKDNDENQIAFQALQVSGYIRYEDLPLETKWGVRREVEFISNIYWEGLQQVIQCNIRDITERKRAEAALREQVALLADAQRIGRMGNWSLDLRSGRLVWLEATCNLFGITPAEFAETLEHFYSFILAEDVPAYMAALARVSLTEPLLEAEYRIRRPDGTVRWMYERSKTEFDAAGSPIARVGIVLDITERHAAREQLAQSAALLAQIAGKAARLGGWMIELPDRTLTWSDENCAIHDVPPGYKPTLEEGLGYFPPEYRVEVVRHVEECVREGTPYDFEFPKFTAKGRLIWVRSIGEAVRDAEGKIIRLQGAFQDITVRKQAEAEKEKLIEELQTALAEVGTLREFLPICSYCKKIRDDQDYWSQIESYISKHTSTQFSHSICPECYETNVAPKLEEMKQRIGRATRV
jgi:PAS domain S-box-containing protein